MSQASSERKPIGKIIDGCLDLSGREFGDRDLKRLGVLPALRTLILTDTEVSNFALLKPQPKLETIVAINCPVQYLNGLSEQPSLNNLDLTNTPISEKSNYRSLIMASIGKSLKIINNVKTTKVEIKNAQILQRGQKEQLFLLNEDDEAPENSELLSEEDRQAHDAMTTVYVKEHQKLFSTFADNEAVLIDLESGPLPIIDEQSTEADLRKAIKDLKKRNERLKEIIQQKQEELGIDVATE